LGGDEENDRYSMRSVDRITSILSFISEHETGSLPDISEATGLARSTVFRLAEALVSSGLLVRAGDAGYRISPRLVYIALKGPGILDLRSVAQPVMVRLAEETGETVALSIRLEGTRMYVGQVESRQPIRRVIEMNEPLPLSIGASAKALLAWVPEPEARRILEGTRSRWPDCATAPHLERFLAELPAVRKEGFAMSSGERVADGAAVAAPILADNGDVLGSLAVMAPRHRTPDEKLRDWGPLVVRAARDVAVASGARHPGRRAPSR